MARAEAGAPTSHVEPIDAPTRRTDEQAVDRQAVAVGAQRKAVEIDGDARRPVAPRRQPVPPGGQQREPGGAARPQRTDAAGKGEVLAPTEAQRDTRHADRRKEGGRELTGLQGDPRLTTKSAFPRPCGHVDHVRHGAPGRLPRSSGRVKLR